MPTEVKQRKKSAKSADEAAQTTGIGKNEAQREKTDAGKNNVNKASLDFRTLLCLLTLASSGVLSWMVLQQNERFSQIEEEYRLLQGRTASLFNMEEEVLKASKKLAVSEGDLQEALSAVAAAERLQRDIASLRGVVVAMQADEDSASRDLQVVNARFLNVTETWQGRLAAVASDLEALKAESRDAHAGANERVNEAERRARSLAEKLEELEDSTRRNARAMERAEEDDAKRAQGQLDWNTEQIRAVAEQVRSLAEQEAELGAQLDEHVPRALECEKYLPQVEEAVRSILRLGGDLSAAERRLEEATLQVFGTEDSMLKALDEILEMRRELDALQARNSILKMKNELAVVKEAVRELTTVLKENAMGAENVEEEEEEEWKAYEEEEEEEWANEERDAPVPERSDLVG